MRRLRYCLVVAAATLAAVGPVGSTGGQLSLESQDFQGLFILGDCDKVFISPGNCDSDGGYCCTC